MEKYGKKIGICRLKKKIIFKMVLNLIDFYSYAILQRSAFTYNNPIFCVFTVHQHGGGALNIYIQTCLRALMVEKN